MAHKAPTARRWLARLTLAILLATLCINLLSAYIRHVEAGLDCADWPACYARIGTHIEQQTTQGVARSALAPQPLAKQTHRGVATVLVILVLVLLQRSRSGVALRGREAQLPLLMAALLLVLAVIGPASYLKTLPAIATANLLGGLALAALSFRLWLSLGGTPRHGAAAGLRRLARWALLMLCLQLALGAWMSANFAALGCEQLLSCREEGGNGIAAFWYLRELALDAGGQVLSGQGSVVIHLAHRIGALASAALLLALLVSVLRALPALRFQAAALLVLLLAQIGLGVLAVTHSLPLWVVLAHNSCAALLLLCAIRIDYGLGQEQRA